MFCVCNWYPGPVFQHCPHPATAVLYFYPSLSFTFPPSLSLALSLSSSLPLWIMNEWWKQRAVFFSRSQPCTLTVRSDQPRAHLGSDHNGKHFNVWVCFPVLFSLLGSCLCFHTDYCVLHVLDDIDIPQSLYTCRHYSLFKSAWVLERKDPVGLTWDIIGLLYLFFPLFLFSISAPKTRAADRNLTNSLC